MASYLKKLIIEKIFELAIIDYLMIFHMLSISIINYYSRNGLNYFGRFSSNYQEQYIVCYHK